MDNYPKKIKKQYGLIIFITLAVIAALFIKVEYTTALVENVTQAAIVEGAAESGGATGAAAGTIVAEGGNITEANISAFTQTDQWQGFWGTFTNAGLALNDASGNTFHNWSAASFTAAEIYFSPFVIYNWTNVEAGSDANVTYAMENLSYANVSRSDNLTSTYSEANGHENFNLEGRAITGAAALSLEGGTFNATMLWYNETNEPVFAAIVRTTAQTAFNGENANYEILVPINTSLSAPETYYVYAEVDV